MFSGFPSPCVKRGGVFLSGSFPALADDRRIDDLDSRIASAKAGIERPAGAAMSASESRGWAIGIEFVGAVLVGAFIGYLLDKWLHTAPWLMIVLLCLGFAAGLRRAMKTSNQLAGRFDADSANDAR